MIEPSDRANTTSGRAPLQLASLRRLGHRWAQVAVTSQALFDQALVSGTTFVTAVIIGRTCTPSQLGLYYLALSIVVVASGIQDNLIACPYTIYSKRHRGLDLASYLGSSWVHHLLLTAAAVGLMLVAAAALTAAGASELSPALWVLVWVTPFVLLRDGVRRFVLADLQVTTAIAIDATVAVLQLGGLLLLAYYGRLSVGTIFAVIAGAALVASAWYAMQSTPISLRRSRIWPDWSRSWSFAKWSLRSYLVGNTVPYVMPWLVTVIIDTAATGILGACTTLVGVANVFISGMANLLMPQAAEAYVEEGPPGLARVLRRAATLLVVVLGSISLALFFVGEPLAVALYGENFHGCGPILVALAVGATLNGVGMVVGMGLWAIDNPRSNFVADVACAATTLTAAALLIFRAGVLGAAVATLLGIAAGLVVRVAILWRTGVLSQQGDATGEENR